MSIAFPCSCGKTLRADDANAGRTVRCPNCAELVIVPTKELGDEVVEGEEDRGTTAPVKDEEFEVLEDDCDLPTVERVKKRRKKEVVRDAPRRKTVQDELYDDSSSTAGMESAKYLLYGAFVLCFGCVVACLVLCVLGRLMNMGHGVR